MEAVSEQAKFVTQASRLIGLGFFAAVGYHDTIAFFTGRFMVVIKMEF
ncbi:hypothetical protein ACQUQQ_08320 [Acidithiobacillus ferrooxidans]